MPLQSVQGSQASLGGQEIYRLTETLESSGSIFEIDVGCQALIIGPDSDISQCNVTYFDPLQPQNVNQLTVSIDSPYIGRIDANPAQPFPFSGNPGKLYVTPRDKVENIAVTQSISFIKPKIDLLCYLTPPSNIPTARRDFETEGRVQIVDAGGGQGSTSFYFPFYKRRFLAIRTRSIAAGTRTVAVNGIKFRVQNLAYSVPLFAATAFPGAGAVLSIVLTASQLLTLATVTSGTGFFDYIQVIFAGDAISGTASDAPNYNIVASDVGQ